MSVRRLDEVDYRILEQLQKNARVSYTELAEKVGLSTSRCQRRVRGLEEAGIIKAYATLVCQTVLGLPINVFVMVTLDREVKQSIDAFEAAIADWPEIMECYMMTGDADYMLRVVAADLKAYHRFLIEKLTPLSCVASIKSSFALKQVAYKTAIPIDEISLGATEDGRKIYNGAQDADEDTQRLTMKRSIDHSRRTLAKRSATATGETAKATQRHR